MMSLVLSQILKMSVCVTALTSFVRLGSESLVNLLLESVDSIKLITVDHQLANSKRPASMKS